MCKVQSSLGKSKCEYFSFFKKEHLITGYNTATEVIRNFKRNLLHFEHKYFVSFDQGPKQRRSFFFCFSFYSNLGWPPCLLLATFILIYCTRLTRISQLLFVGHGDTMQLPTTLNWVREVCFDFFINIKLFSFSADKIKTVALFSIFRCIFVSFFAKQKHMLNCVCVSCSCENSFVFSFYYHILIYDCTNVFWFM